MNAFSRFWRRLNALCFCLFFGHIFAHTWSIAFFSLPAALRSPPAARNTRHRRVTLRATDAGPLINRNVKKRASSIKPTVYKRKSAIDVTYPGKNRNQPGTKTSHPRGVIPLFVVHLKQLSRRTCCIVCLLHCCCCCLFIISSYLVPVCFMPRGNARL